MRIFILEDDAYRISAFEACLEGHDLTICQDIERAKKMWNPPYDLALLDHDLEGRGMASDEDNTGYAFVKWALYNKPFKGSPVIIHSWNTDGGKNMLHALQDSGVKTQLQMFGTELLKALKRIKV